MAMVSYAKRLADLAAAEPDRPVVTCGPTTLTRAELERRGNRFARDLQARGIGTGDFVTVAVPNSVEWFVAYVACWKIGATPQQVSARLPQRELVDIVTLAGSKAVVGVEPDALGRELSHVECIPFGYEPPASISDEPLPDAVSPAWKAPTSGGSTGRPKLIVSGDPSMFDTDAPSIVLLEPNGCLVMPGPLFHNGPGVWSCQGLLYGNHVVVLPRFDAEATLAAIAEHGADVVYLVPTMMKRILRLPDDVRLSYDLSSLRIVWHLAEPCPAWLKEAWIDWLGPERIFELYAGTEAQGVTVITGTEWLEHRGSVGRPTSGEFMVTDEVGNLLPPGQQGEIWIRSTSAAPTYRYVGAEPRTLGDGWESLGDNGWFDEDGYLYLGDRMQDMILCGGSNVYPAEVEAAIQEHPAVRSVAVIGLPDEDKGNVVHAIVEADPTEVSAAELLAFVGERLVTYKLPRTVEFVDVPLRDDAGKVRRSALRAERV
ncbi:AMP-binding protein [Desertimonas flava]|uniref:AMP-binding protein n=1 Tax=Desertimonas flava TaxID=2064846 RepID=UPI000E340DFD|nr:AMP-binding protein [Desertimonas flava]